MMGTCLLLIVLAWSFVWRLSVTAAVVMSVVAMVIPPFAAIIGNSGVQGPTDTGIRPDAGRPRRR
jgi:hypothetical protein